jgi:cytochrome c oxidase assembly factor CtaG
VNEIRWWCSAQAGQVWTGSFQAYPGIWLFLLAILGLYIRAIARARAQSAPEGVSAVSRSQLLAFASGFLLLWVVLDWPVGPLAAGYLLTAHMAQYLLISLIITPFLDAGMPSWMLQALCRASPLGWVVGRPLLAFLLFNATMVFTHLPALADRLKPLQFGSMAIDLAWIASAMLFWWSIRTDAATHELAGRYGKRLLYVAGIKILPIFLGAFFVFAEFPLFQTFELAPRATSLNATDDQLLAGVLIWMGTTPILLFRLASAWFSWYALESAPPETR